MTSTITRPNVRAGIIGATAIAPVVWGTTYIVTTELLPTGHPSFASVARALPAGLLLIVIGGALPRGDWWWKAAVLGVLNIGIFFPMLFVAAERLPGGVAATLGAGQPIIVAVLAVILAGERFSVRRIGWGAVGVVGVALVVIGPSAAADLVGVAAGLAGAASMALGVTLTKRWGRPPGAGPAALAGWQLTAGGLFLVPWAAAEGVPDRIDGSAITGYLWLGLAGGALAYYLWFRGVGRLQVSAAAMLGLLSPLAAAGLGMAIAHERFSALQVVGFALAITALLAAQAPRR